MAGDGGDELPSDDQGPLNKGPWGKDKGLACVGKLCYNSTISALDSAKTEIYSANFLKLCHSYGTHYHWAGLDCTKQNNAPKKQLHGR